jgi:hypothetical protein
LKIHRKGLEARLSVAGGEVFFLLSLCFSRGNDAAMRRGGEAQLGVRRPGKGEVDSGDGGARRRGAAA